MYEAWPFFRVVIDNATKALSQIELDVTSDYAGLADEELREKFFPRIEQAYERADALVTEVAK